MTKPILIVDDYDDILFLIGLTLESDGYKVKSATSGWEALELAREIRPQLVLMDVMMPGLNGLEVTKQMRQEPELASTRILLVSANHQINVEQAEEIGANGILYKPFDIDSLSLQVHQLLKPTEEAAEASLARLV